jgi:hypothetical protein
VESYDDSAKQCSLRELVARGGLVEVRDFAVAFLGDREGQAHWTFSEMFAVACLTQQATVARYLAATFRIPREFVTKDYHSTRRRDPLLREVLESSAPQEDKEETARFLLEQFALERDDILEANVFDTAVNAGMWRLAFELAERYELSYGDVLKTLITHLGADDFQDILNRPICPMARVAANDVPK